MKFIRISSALARGVYDCAVCIQVWAKFSHLFLHFLISTLQRNTPNSPTWACCSCMCVLHLNCAVKWQAQQLGTSRMHDRAPCWCCPSCRVSLPPAALRYTCFCGAIVNPKVCRGVLPHACGEQCRRKTSRFCQHPCQSLCHPGPCPPCSAVIRSRCFCGAEDRVVRCSTARADVGALSCGSRCSRLLNCGLHACSRNCHPGSCDDCAEVTNITCFCGRHVANRSCGFGQLSVTSGQMSFSCGAVCGRLLANGLPCILSCHDGLCPSSASFPRARNTTDCGKLLPCMHHACTLVRDHSGPCNSCNSQQSRSCGCGAERLTLKCVHITSAAELAFSRGMIPDAGDELPLVSVDNAPPPVETTLSSVLAVHGPGGLSVRAMDKVQQAITAIFKCQKMCNSLKNCGRHRCSSTCCSLSGISDLHDCALPCGRQLRCGLHTCQQLCHRGPCKSCPVMHWQELSCTCGHTVLPPPQPCGTPIPECFQRCIIVQSCGHAATHPCHPRSQACQPCQTLADKPCGCGRRLIRNVPCSSTVVSCSQVCGRPLSCGVHLCPRRCHYGECSAATAASRVGLPKVAPRSDTQTQSLLRAACEDALQCVWDGTTQAAIDPSLGWGAAFDPSMATSLLSDSASNSSCSLLPESVCDYVCGSVLPCGHTCKLPCHGSSSCFSHTLPDNPCALTMQNSCLCGSLKEVIICNGKVPMAPLLCSSSCTQLKPFSGESDATSATSSHVLQSLSSDIWGLDLILTVRHSMTFLLRLESALNRLIAAIPAKCRWQPAGTLKASPEALWPMPAEQRYIVHRVCEKYGLVCTSMLAADAARVPHVTVTESCMEPSVRLSQAVSLYSRSNCRIVSSSPRFYPSVLLTLP